MVGSGFSRRIGWRGAYALALANAAVFACGSLAMLGLGTGPVWVNAVLAAAFAGGALLSGGLMILTGGVLAALPAFTLGAGLFYGLGTMLATLDTETMAALYFTAGTQQDILTQVNAVNASAILVVTAMAGLFCGAGPVDRRGRQSGFAVTLGRLAPLRLVLLWASLPYMALLWLGFGQPLDPMIASLMSLLRGLPLFAILLAGILWHRLRPAERGLAVVLLLGLSLHGFLNLAKLATLVPWITLAIGWWLNGRMRRLAALIVVGAVALYVAGFAELVRYGRYHPAYEPGANTVAERVRIVAETAGQLDDLVQQTRDGAMAQRFTLAPYQAYFIKAYDTGTPGESLRNMAIVLVPRVIWPDKPTFAPGREFDIAFRGADIANFLAIGFPAEAYWNEGWWGVVVIAMLIGCQIGWLTRKWFLFLEHGPRHIGIFAFSALVVLQAFWVESSIVGVYVGAMTKLLIMIMATDLFARWVLAREARARAVRLPIRAYGAGLSR